MTVLYPNPHITRISTEGLPIELGGKLPLPLVSGMIGKIDEILLPAEAKQVNGAAQSHFTPIKVTRALQKLALDRQIFQTIVATFYRGRPRRATTEPRPRLRDEMTSTTRIVSKEQKPAESGYLAPSALSFHLLPQRVKVTRRRWGSRKGASGFRAEACGCFGEGSLSNGGWSAP